VISSIFEEGRFVRQLFPLVLLLTIAAVLVPGSARPAATGTLTGAVGQGDAFSITLKDAAGHAVTQLDPGSYTITVTDYSTLHNFHLFGPGGVDQATDVDLTGTVTWDVTLSDGVYTYRCDAHPTQMKHTFRVGAAPPAPPKLSGKVGPGNTISLKKGSAIVKALTAGTYKVTVKDASTKDNFHLLGPGVSKRTAVRGKGTFGWKLTFKKGKYTYRSDAHKTLKRTFKVLAPPTP
jgi:plastocyanin